MSVNSSQESEKDAKYLQFLRDTFQADKLRDVHDAFAQKAFDYLESDSEFDLQVFPAFVLDLIGRCKQKVGDARFRLDWRRLHTRSSVRGNVLSSNGPATDSEIAAEIRHSSKDIQTDIYSFITQFPIIFVVKELIPNTVPISIEKKLKHLLYEEAYSQKSASVQVISPTELEFKLFNLTTTQKLDVMHFVLCALNHLAMSDVFLKEVIKPVKRVREVIAVTGMESTEQPAGDLTEDKSTIYTRILESQTEDPKIEELWANEKPPVFFNGRANVPTILMTDEESQSDKDLKKESTTTRQVLALRYLLEYVKAKDKFPDARKRFAKFMISKDPSAVGKKFDDETLAYTNEGADLLYVKQLFEAMELDEIARMIKNDMS